MTAHIQYCGSGNRDRCRYEAIQRRHGPHQRAAVGLGGHPGLQRLVRQRHVIDRAHAANGSGISWRRAQFHGISSSQREAVQSFWMRSATSAM
ncbi:hypothetical protein [Mesorhizobium sp. M0991]|uniref:hypothetical protein n=1 Tax=Mesorhizobium sp. M0991 TaxID=2957043 RepID=UPI00333824FD